MEAIYVIAIILALLYLTNTPSQEGYVMNTMPMPVIPQRIDWLSMSDLDYSKFVSQGKDKAVTIRNLV